MPAKSYFTAPTDRKLQVDVLSSKNQALCTIVNLLSINGPKHIQISSTLVILCKY